MVTERGRDASDARSQQRDDPIVVGGMGGSGTRAVAGLLQSCGLQTPGPLNPQLDNSWATLLFRRPRWVPLLAGAQRSRPAGELVEAFAVLRQLFAGARLDVEQLSMLATAAAETAVLGYESSRAWTPPTSFRLIANYLDKPPEPLEPGPWGWSHAVNQLMLPELLAAFPNTRYIHVLRHPLEMAWSENLQGVRLWGTLCGVDDQQIAAAPQNAQLAWWLYSTGLATAAGRDMGDRFLLIRIEQLVEHPIAVARRLVAFAGLEPDQPTLRQAAGNVELPASSGRAPGELVEGIDPALLAEAQVWIKRWEAQPPPEAPAPPEAPGPPDAAPAESPS